ncbi:MAG: universal stress protein [Saprospiraceae bacterium]|nr:universal stress protein [Saprospiraceae bacterium]MCF8250233.1 universal stress protein [Saprospiraceae bacterium]MCF8280004.1 universal stress protein [Bacteroidales bacterium]MCF8312041.1 universal stress protein [Saprospiraceae bacterium]MCF8441138.1 universal stress protein [Saprospiraceae bacterium]
MKIINNILVPTDFSPCAENAYQFSLELADKWQSSIKLLHVVTPDYAVTDIPVVVDLATKDKILVAQKLLNDFKENGINKFKATHNKAPLVSDVIKVSGLSYAAIATVAEEEDFDLILMGTNSYHSAWETTFGTNAATVVKQAHCHVFVVPDYEAFKGFTTVGFAADLHETDPYHLWKTCKMMEPFHSIIHCVHVEKEGKAKETKLRIEELEAFFINNPVALQMTFHTFEEASIETGLEDFANEWNLDLLVMSSPHRDVFSRLFHKSMTKQMALHSKVPLLVLK